MELRYKLSRFGSGAEAANANLSCVLRAALTDAVTGAIASSPLGNTTILLEVMSIWPVGRSSF